EFGLREDLLRAANDPRTGRLIVIIGDARPLAGTCLDLNAMAAFDELAHGSRHQPDAIFLRFDLLGHTDQHDDLATSELSIPRPRHVHSPVRDSGQLLKSR